MTAVEALLDRLPRTSLIVGKGGVGKTTCAAGIAALFAQRGEPTLLVSTDPAAALSTVLGAPVATSASAVAGQPNLDARQLSASELRREFLDQWRSTIAEIVDRGTYLDREDIDGLVDAALPGADEIFALLALAELLADTPSTYARIVVDTAPTGHTLRLLALPQTFRAVLSLLDLMQDKHRFMVRALTRRYRRDSADQFLDEMRARIDGLRGILSDDRALAAVVVTRDEPVVAAETARYVASLRALQVRVTALLTNAADANVIRSSRTAPSEDDRPDIDDLARFWIPRAPEPPHGLTSVLDTVRRMRSTVPRLRHISRFNASTVHPAAQATDLASLVRILTIVGGKGGVGKSTVSCALAIHVADHTNGTTLLVSTDPAPSIADALGAGDAPWAIADVEAALPDVSRLIVRQMDASTAFARLRDTYETRVDALFEGMVGHGIDLEHDRAILRDLLALAPPGIDELYALSVLGDALAEGRFARVIVDPAPTGHLLRLLEMPAVALNWTHRLMRLVLKYRDVVGLGEAAEELLAFAKRTRALDALLHDPARSSVVIVSLDEPVVRAETERLTAAVRGYGIDVGPIIWNRVTGDPAPLPTAPAVNQYCAKEVQPPPVGASALRAWAGAWRAVSLNS